MGTHPTPALWLLEHNVQHEDRAVAASPFNVPMCGAAAMSMAWLRGTQSSASSSTHL